MQVVVEVACEAEVWALIFGVYNFDGNLESGVWQEKFGKRSLVGEHEEGVIGMEHGWKETGTRFLAVRDL